MKMEGEYSFQNVVILLLYNLEVDKVQENNFTDYKAPSSEIFWLQYEMI